jgi:hypothetical protein
MQIQSPKKKNQPFFFFTFMLLIIRFVYLIKLNKLHEFLISKLQPPLLDYHHKMRAALANIFARLLTRYNKPTSSLQTRPITATDNNNNNSNNNSNNETSK